MSHATRLLLVAAVAWLACGRLPAQDAGDPPPAEVSRSFLDDLFGRYLPKLGYSYDAGESVGRDAGGLSSFQAFVPVWESGEASRLVFTDTRLLVFDSRGTVGANLGLGGRLFSDTLGRTVGGYVYYDYSDTGRASFKQFSGGIETLGDRIDARANFYVPLGKERKTIEQFFTPTTEPYFQNNQLLVGGGQGTRSIEQALYGFDTEAGLRFFASDSLELRAFAGMYHLQGEDTAGAWGPRGRIEARLRDSLAMGLSVQNDRLYGTTVNLNVLVSFGRLSGRAYSDGPAAPLTSSDRLGDPVVRMSNIAVLRKQERYVVAGTPAVDPATGQPYLFLHVAAGGNSDGSVESPYGNLAAAFADPRFAKGNVIVYDRSQGTFTGDVTFAPGTRLLSAGPVQVIETSNLGAMRLPFSGAGMGVMPRITGRVVLASGGVLSGFDVVGSGGAAISTPAGTEVRDVTVTQNKVTGDAAAVALPNVSGKVVVKENRIDAPAGAGVQVGVKGDASASLEIRDNQIKKAAGDGVKVEAGGSAKVQARVEGNTVRDGLLGDGAIVLEALGTTGSALLAATVGDNQLPNNQAPGVTARAGGTNVVELDLFGNKALSSQAMFGFLLQQRGKSTFGVYDPDTLGARNVGSVVTSGTLTAIP